MSEICPNAEKCPIFSGILRGKNMTTQAYHEQYCEAGESRITKCKRWQVKERYKKCPEGLLPNSFDTVEEIGKMFNLE